MSFPIGGTRLHTRALGAGESISIVNSSTDPPVLRASIIVSSGTCTINGNFTYQGVASSAISLSAGQVDSISAVSAMAPLDGVTITAVGGTTNIELSF